MIFKDNFPQAVAGLVQVGSPATEGGRGDWVSIVRRVMSVMGTSRYGYCLFPLWLQGGRVTNAVGTIFRKIFVGTRARPI